MNLIIRLATKLRFEQRLYLLVSVEKLLTNKSGNFLWKFFHHHDMMRDDWSVQRFRTLKGSGFRKTSYPKSFKRTPCVGASTSIFKPKIAAKNIFDISFTFSNKVSEYLIAKVWGLVPKGDYCLVILVSFSLLNEVKETYKMIHKDNKKNENQTEGGEFVQPIFDGMAKHLITVLRTELPHLALAKEAISILEIYVRNIGDEILLSVKEAVGDLAFSNYFAICSLLENDGGRWNSILLDDIIFDDEMEERKGIDLITELSEQINYFNGVDWFNKLLKKLCDFLALSKEEVINDFVIPNYKVFKTSHIWLEEQTESAFNKAVRKSFGKDFGFWLDIFDDFRESLTVADHVSIFEYFLEGLDLQKLHSSTTLTESEIRFLLDLNCRDLDGIHQECDGWPSLFVEEVLYLQEAYGFCLGDFLKSPRFTEGEERLKTPFEISDFLESFQPLASSFYEDSLGYSTPIEDWKILLEFALATLSRREEWTKAILLEEETFEDY